MTDFQRAALAQKLLNFGKACEDLTEFSKAFEDLDWSEGYPFHLLDIEAITPAVKAWCTLTANRLLAGVIVTVPNPVLIAWRYLDGPQPADPVLPEVGYDPRHIYEWLEKYAAAPAAATFECVYTAYIDFVAQLKTQK